jgi:hypothetical protein
MLTRISVKKYKKTLNIAFYLCLVFYAMLFGLTLYCIIFNP